MRELSFTHAYLILIPCVSCIGAVIDSRGDGKIVHGHDRCVGHETWESYRKTKGGMTTPYFRGHENPAT